jgi:hypothetical protein
VILPYVGGTQRDRCGLPVNLDATAQAKMASWPNPSLLHTEGTWLADAKPGSRGDVNPAAKAKSAGTFDAYLYLGPPSLFLSELPSVFTFVNKDLLAELQDRMGDARTASNSDGLIRMAVVVDATSDSSSDRAGP